MFQLGYNRLGNHCKISISIFDNNERRRKQLQIPDGESALNRYITDTPRALKIITARHLSPSTDPLENLVEMKDFIIVFH